MIRIPEPELMDDVDQARAYAAADFSAPNNLFVRLFTESFPFWSTGDILDLGCGPADIAILLACAFPKSIVFGLDGAAAMLDRARQNIASKAVSGRVQLLHATLPDPHLTGKRYDAIISNSFLHHLPDPMSLWSTIGNCGRHQAAVLVMDLMRPQSKAEAEQIVATYAAHEPAILKRDFYNSLLAAYRPGEVREQLWLAGLASLTVTEVSDRHMAVRGLLP